MVVAIFRQANARIAELVSDPLIADDVRAFAAERHNVNEVRADGNSMDDTPSLD